LLNNWVKHFRVINAFLLSKTSRNQTHLISLNNVVNMMLYFVHPPIANIIHRMMKGNQRPGVVRAQGLNLIAQASCQASFLSTSKNAMGSEVGEDITRKIGVTTVVETIKFVVFSCRG